MFLPFIGFALLGQHLYRKLSAAGRTVGEEMGAAIAPRMTPGVVTFTPSEETSKEEKPAETETPKS
jgi:hypothetical protein